MATDDDFKKLSPENRAKKLQEMIEIHSKEIEQKKEELRRAKELQKKTEEEQITELIAVREKQLQEEEQQVKKLLTETESLDERLGDIVPLPEKEHELIQQQETTQYITATTASKDLYQSAVEMYGDITGGVTAEQAEQAGTILYALEKKNDQISSGEYTTTDEIRRQADAAFAIAEKILSIYTGGVKQQPPGTP